MSRATLTNKRLPYLPLTVAILLVAAGVMFFFVDPVKATWAPKCMFHTLTGWQCPGCGISRASHALLHGHLREALAYNYFFIFSIPYFLAVCAATFFPCVKRRYTKFYNFIIGTKPAYTYIALFCIWWVIRNIMNI